MTEEGWRKTLAFAESLADAARAESLAHFRRPLPVETKGDCSPVTLADRAAEKVMREIIARDDPAAGVIGEEFGAERAGAERVWVLDPIDGTRSFISGSSQYNTLIALLCQGEPVIGVIDMPALDERWSGVWAGDFSGAWFNGAPCQTAAGAEVAAAVMVTTTAFGVGGTAADERRLHRLGAAVSQTRLGGDSSAYGCVASGFCHLAADFRMQPYDYLPVAPIVLAAGGVISDWQGNALSLASGDEQGVLAAADAALHRRALDILNEQGGA